MTEKNTYQTILNTLRHDIIHGVWKPGQKLVEQELASRYKISRTPLREAIRQLQAQGMIDAIPNHGSRVAILSLTDINELFELRELLEHFAVQRSTQYMPQTEIQRLKTLYEKMKANYETSHLIDNYENISEFHMTLMSHCRNSALRQMIGSVIKRFAPFRYLMVSSMGSIKVYDHLGKILSFLDKRDAKAVANELSASLMTYKAIIFDEVIKAHPKLIKQDITE